MSRATVRKRLSEVLVSQGLLTHEAVEEALARMSPAQTSLGDLLLQDHALTEEQLGRALAEQYGLVFESLQDCRVNPDFYHSVPVELMHRHPFVPLDEYDGALVIAVPDPHDLPSLDELELMLNRPLLLRVSTKTSIQAALSRSEGSMQALKAIEAEYRSVLVREDERGDEVLSVEKITKDQSPVVKLVDTILLSALEKRASDIHIEPTDRAVQVRFRLDGILIPALEPLDIKLHASLVSRLKVMSELDIAERRIPQDGRFGIRIDRKRVDFRVSVLPSSFGESVVIRILDRESITAGVSALRLDRLGFTLSDLKRFRRAIHEPYGMVLVTGPTGSGKTTTLYAAITEINTVEDKLITIEDPVEYHLPGVVQIQVNEKKGLTFARGLRSILRHDPDKVMVGEIRDAETAQIAIQSALTGHLVFTTVHANNAFDVIGRFVNMGIEPYNFVSSLNCILAQRLLRMNCLNCREQVALDPQEAEISGLDFTRYKTVPFHRGRGCEACHGTGYRGRQNITEFLHLSDEIKEMILARKPPTEIRLRAVADGMTSMRQSAMAKVLAGETTLKEINRVSAVDPI
ncbi:MAG: pilus assembly protein PilB [Nitrospira sp.]|nr:MAG: pilus assembly protein PilB [Nitrospira sp.]